MHNQQRAIEHGDLTRLVVRGEIVEERRRDRKRAPTDRDHRGAVRSDVVLRVGDQTFDVARRSGRAHNHDAADVFVRCAASRTAAPPRL